MLHVEQVTHAFAGLPVLRGVNLEVRQGEILCLLGPSGSGKTTLLRIIAGLEQIESGDVLLEGRSVRDAPPHARGFGLMFQDLALFPHMNVAENIVFGVRMQGMPRHERQMRLAEVVELVGLAGMERRDVTQLSGGERQRVALARSLAPRPRLLMLDEPLGSLDAALRERLVVDLHAIIKQVGLTAIYVTHDQQEAYAIADRIAIMNRGVIEQVDTPEQIYRRPRTTFVARFLGLNNIVPVLGRNGAGSHTAVGDFPVSDAADALLLHPRGIRLATSDAPGSLSGVVEERVFQGEHYRLVVRFPEGITITFTEASHAPAVGETVTIQVDPSMAVPLKSSDGSG